MGPATKAEKKAGFSRLIAATACDAAQPAVVLFNAKGRTRVLKIGRQ